MSSAAITSKLKNIYSGRIEREEIFNEIEKWQKFTL